MDLLVRSVAAQLFSLFAPFLAFDASGFGSRPGFVGRRFLGTRKAVINIF